MVNSEHLSPEKSSSGDPPPLLIGGVRQPQASLLCAGCDYLTVSMSASMAEILKGAFPLAREQSPMHFKGFKFHEMRASLGGACDRHWGPHTGSKVRGKDFELWGWRGEVASGALYSIRNGAGILNTSELFVATRFDMAFDFHCDPDLSPMSVRDAWAAVWREELRLRGRIAGEDSSADHTAYIGGMTSDRMIRIYRKDLERGFGIPTLRVELVLKGEFAQEALEKSLENDRIGVDCCAAHVFAMTGCEFLDHLHPVRLRTPKKKVPIAATLAAMVEQYSLVLTVASELGIDLDSLTGARARQISRATRYKWKRALEEAREAGGEEIRRAALDLVLNGR